MPCFCRYMPIRRFQSHSVRYQLPAFPIRPSHQFHDNISLYVFKSKTGRDTTRERITTAPAINETRDVFGNDRYI